MRKKQPRNSAPISDAAIDRAKVALIEERAARDLRTYREIKILLKHSGQRGKTNKKFEALAMESPNADALLAMHAMPRRDASLRAMVIRDLTECSNLRQPAPGALIELMNALFLPRKGDATVAKESSLIDRKAFCFVLLRDNRSRTYSDRFLAKLACVSAPTIQAWRKHFEHFNPEADPALALKIEAKRELEIIRRHRPETLAWCRKVLRDAGLVPESPWKGKTPIRRSRTR